MDRKKLIGSTIEHCFRMFILIPLQRIDSVYNGNTTITIKSNKGKEH